MSNDSIDLKKHIQDNPELAQNVAKIKSKKLQENIHSIPVKLEIESIQDVKEVPINWLWKNIIAYGKITLFAGEPGVGKSQLLLYIASIMSQGRKYHFDNTTVEKANVLLVSGEDNADDTLKPRLMALDADLTSIQYLKGIKRTDLHGNEYYDAVCLMENLHDIEAVIKEKQYKLIIVDPIALYLGNVDEHNNKEIRSALSRLQALAERNNLALVLNSHFSKPGSSGTKNAINRVMGSIGFAAAARIVFGIMKDPENPARRLFVPIKNNIGKDDEGYVYEIEGMVVGENKNIETSRVSWLNEKITKTANELLNPPVEIKSPKLDEVKEFLLDMLKDGEKHLTEIRQEYKKLGHSIDRLYKAKFELKIVEDEYYDGKKRKIWRLP